MPTATNYAFLENILTPEQYSTLGIFLDNYFGVSDTYKFLFLLYFSFVVTVLLINIISKIVKVYYSYRIRKLEKLI